MLIESDGTVEGTTVKDDNGEPLGLVTAMTLKVSRLGTLERLELTINESATARKKAARVAAAAEAEGEAPPA